MLSAAKLLFMSFITILLGVVLIQPIADDISTASDSSITVSNETLSFSSSTTAVSNETLAWVNATTAIVNESVTMDEGNITANLTYNDLTTFTGLTNSTTNEDIIGFCNVTLATGALTCNFTGSNAIFANYTYISGKTETFYYDDLTALTAVRNISSQVITGYCNITLATGGLVCNNTYGRIGYGDYTYISRRTETLANDEVISISELRNSSSDVMTGECNVTLSTGSLVCNNTHNATGYADYTYEPDTYVHSRTARVMLSNTSLFFAIAVLIIGIGFAIAGFKVSGIM